MPQVHQHPLLVILLVAALAPVFNELPLRPRLPLVVLELLFGIVIGPNGLDLASNEGSLKALSALGLSFLFFLAGMELDFSALRGPPLRLGAVGWLTSLGLSLGLAYGLAHFGLVADPLFVAVALSTTAIGTLVPILREAELLDSDFGRFVLGAGAAAEFGPIVLFSLIVTGDQGFALRSGLLLTFAFIAIASAALVLRVRPPHVVDVLSRSLHGTSQLPVRLAMLTLGGLVVLADTLGLDLLLGAFAAGTLVGLVARGPEAEPFRHKLDALGFGFLIPIFFIVSGTQIDLPALFAGSGTLLRVPLFLGLLLLVRGAPALFYRRHLAWRERLALGLLSATTLPLVVVIADIGKATGRMLPENAAALIGAGVLSVVVFPLLAIPLQSRRLQTASP